MSQNAEPKAKMEALNHAEWSAVSDIEKTAVRAAIKAYGASPGNSEQMAMMRGIRAYLATMGTKR